MSTNVPLISYPAPPRNARKYNIAPEFSNSPYLSKPIGSHEKLRQSVSPADSSKSKSTKGNPGDTDTESLASLKSHRSEGVTQSYRSSQNSARKNVSMKSFLLPREMEKLLREFRQKNSNHPILRTQSVGQLDHEDDNSTIGSDFAEDLDDEDVYFQCRKEQVVQDALFSSPLFAELTFRNAAKERLGVPTGPILMLPPFDRIDDEGSSEEASNFDSLHSGAGSRRRKR
jgi:hypothetical protein